MALPLLDANGWSLDDVPDQSGRTVVVTGANSGLGYHATRAFARKGADVVMACRSLERGERARDDLADAVPADRLAVERLDLADLESVQSFVERFEADHTELHVLCNNAGIMAIPRRETADGFEYQFGVNHLGHFALTGGLLDRLRATEGETRVVTQSSGLHANGEIQFDDLQFEDEYGEWTAYAQSKLANVLFAYELDRRLDAAGSDVASLACHPGYADTNLQRRGPELRGSRLRLWGMQAANALFAQSARRGALPMLYAATSPELTGGEYVGPGGIANLRGAPEVQASSDRSYDEALARRLWPVSEELTGVEYEFGDAVTAE
ncbi:short-chain dehydrogenase/reductase SDR [Salinarchaeum sp. Harcht-Bsk1]|uniref:oxidoreductase n=1 Tax=Salinarchaeum sp. Harcht-Bsk1 TaxID=1333523 RepID=UPI000342302D|nr:oxidoreductase [Salinarchaeum sp. Harcht-Bsk1]AGN02394.1 short-chain dehydrogenase/reductase SDR [Salinarchaeum sp. Harcht-Bsk1]